jgi:hypothetical protein
MTNNFFKKVGRACEDIVDKFCDIKIGIPFMVLSLCVVGYLAARGGQQEMQREREHQETFIRYRSSFERRRIYGTYYNTLLGELAERADANGDGSLNEEEVEGYKDIMREKGFYNVR